MQGHNLKKVTDLCNHLLCTNVATVSKCIHINLMIWHLLKNSSFKPVFCLIGLAAPFYAKVHLSLYYLFYTRLHLLPTAL